MALKLSVKLDDKRLQKDLRQLREVDQNKAAAWGLNAVRKNIKTDVKRTIAQSIPIRASKPISKAASRIWVLRGSGRATHRRLTAVSLQLYKYVPKIWLFGSKTSSADLGDGEFVQTMKSGHVGIFKRTGASSNDGKGKIRQVLIDSSDLTTQQVHEAIVKAGKEDWPIQFKRGAIRYIQKTWQASA